MSASTTLFFPRGYYRITDTIRIVENTRLVGEGLAHVRLAQNSAGRDDPDRPKPFLLTSDSPNASVLMAAREAPGQLFV